MALIDPKYAAMAIDAANAYWGRPSNAYANWQQQNLAQQQQQQQMAQQQAAQQARAEIAQQYDLSTPQGVAQFQGALLADPRFRANPELNTYLKTMTGFIAPRNVSAGQAVINPVTGRPIYTQATADVQTAQAMAQNPELLRATQQAKIDPIAAQRLALDRQKFQAEQERMASGDGMFAFKTPADQRQFANKLRDDYRADLRAFETIRNNYENIMNAPETGTGDYARIVSYAKMLDPTSVVRETEAGMVIESAGIPEAIKGRLSYLLGKGTLGDTARQQLMESAQEVYLARENEAASKARNYLWMAEKAGIDPRAIGDFAWLQEYEMQKSTGATDAEAEAAADDAKEAVEQTAPTSERIGRGASAARQKKRRVVPRNGVVKWSDL